MGLTCAQAIMLGRGGRGRSPQKGGGPEPPPGAGGLRVEPASAPLWAALGACAVAPAVREYALARALALDPKAAPAWVELGRLYCSNGGQYAPRQSPCMRPCSLARIAHGRLPTPVATTVSSSVKLLTWWPLDCVFVCKEQAPEPVCSDQIEGAQVLTLAWRTRASPSRAATSRETRPPGRPWAPWPASAATVRLACTHSLV
jgi:hypothetical protein